MTLIVIINLALALPALAGLVGLVAWAIGNSGDDPRPARTRSRRRLPRPVFPAPTLNLPSGGPRVPIGRPSATRAPA